MAGEEKEDLKDSLEGVTWMNGGLSSDMRVKKFQTSSQNYKANFGILKRYVDLQRSLQNISKEEEIPKVSQGCL